MDKFNIPDIWRLIISIALCQLAGIIGSIFSTPAIPTWYASLNKPLFSPPNWVFGPLWITLFVLMGISLFLVWRKGLEIPYAKSGIMLFNIQLVFNVLWSVVFFGLKSPLGGLIVIIILWILILLTMIEFYKVSELSGALLVPYILWVSFATILNSFLYFLNR